jgi:hypothetical protein
MCGASSQYAGGVYSLASKPSAFMILAKILQPFRRDPMFIVSTRLDSNLAAFLPLGDHRHDILFSSTQRIPRQAQVIQLAGPVSRDNLPYFDKS